MKSSVVAVALTTIGLSSGLVGGTATAYATTTTTNWSATFAEPVGGPASSPFDCPANTPCSSGSGQVIGLGRAQSLGSTIVMHEIFEFAGTPGASDRPNPSCGHPFVGDLTDVIVGGTGRFADAAGTAHGTVKVAGGIATSRLSGTITF